MDEQLDLLPFEVSEMFLNGFRSGARMIIIIYPEGFSDIFQT